VFQIAPGDEAARKEIEPDRLAVVLEFSDRIHDVLLCSDAASLEEFSGPPARPPQLGREKMASSRGLPL
jgi:hypothetical protein